MAGSDPSTTNYPGKIPSGLDRPRVIANDKDLDNESSNSSFTKFGKRKEEKNESWGVRFY